MNTVNSACFLLFLVHFQSIFGCNSEIRPTTNQCGPENDFGQDPSTKCLCGCNQCQVESIIDSMKFNGCAFDYVTPCNSDHSLETGIPFEISGRQNINSKSQSIWISFFDNNGKNSFVVRLQENFKSTFEYPLVLNGDSIILDEEYIIDSVEKWYFIVQQSNPSNHMALNGFYRDNTGLLSDFSVTIDKLGNIIDISMTDCYSNRICGLCKLNENVNKLPNLQLKWINKQYSHCEFTEQQKNMNPSTKNDKLKYNNKNQIINKEKLTKTTNTSLLMRNLLQTTCYDCPEECENNPCLCTEPNLNCLETACHTNGCNQCLDGYFKKEYNYKCEQCQEVFGNACEFCQDYDGCGQCSPGYQRLYDNNCGLYYCECDDTLSPTNNPSKNPTIPPSLNPTRTPSDVPTNNPTQVPSDLPTSNPSHVPSRAPSNNPTRNPTKSPTRKPSVNPTEKPSDVPTSTPTQPPTSNPTRVPSISPSRNPTNAPSNNPSDAPTNAPTNDPTNAPSNNPTKVPSDVPTNAPARGPSNAPSRNPSISPTQNPSNSPTRVPSDVPTNAPSNNPTTVPSNVPTNAPTNGPTNAPSNGPTDVPTSNPTNAPSNNPTGNPTRNPSRNPSMSPTQNPTDGPTRVPSDMPTNAPTNDPTNAPSNDPTRVPSNNPTLSPTDNPTNAPTRIPSDVPTNNPSITPTRSPSRSPTINPTNAPTLLCAEPCEYQPCDCNEPDLHCVKSACHSNGCDQCENEYFKKDYNHKCEQCQELFGQECLFCQDFSGCGQCIDGYHRVFNKDCDMYECVQL